MAKFDNVDSQICKDHCLQQSQHLISLVLAEIALVKTFRGKWSNIKNKLQLLKEQFTDILDLPDSFLVTTCTELIQSILNTLNDTQDLVKQCVDVKIGSGIGRLQIQTSVDVLAMKLDQHLQDCKLLMKIGGVMPESALCCISRVLLGLLQIGNIESKQKALDSLLSLMQQDDKNVYIVAGQGSAPVLAHLLNSRFTEIKERAAAVVCSLAQADSFEHLLAAQEVLPPLVRLLKVGNSVAKEKASVALQALSFTHKNVRSIGTLYGVSGLVDIFQFGTPVAQAAAAGALANLASVPEIRQYFVDEDAIPILIRLTTSGTTLARQHAVDCLQNLASDDDSLRILIAKEGGIRALMFFWDGAATPRAQEIVIGALKNISHCRANSDLFITSGYIPRLVYALNNTEIPSVKQSAAVAIYEFATSMENRKALGESGCIPALVKMFEAESSAEKEAVAQALSVLLLFDGNRKIFRKEVMGVYGTVQLLDASRLNTDKKYPISILLSPCNNAKCKRQMVASGACIYLKELVEMKVSGAKEFLECLERGRLWNIFGRALNCRKSS